MDSAIYVSDNTSGVLMEDWFISLNGNVSSSDVQGSLELFNGVDLNVLIRSYGNFTFSSIIFASFIHSNIWVVLK